MVDQKRNETIRQSIELLYFAYREFTEEPDRILQKRGLNRVHHRILYFIGKRPDGAVNELLRVMKISKQALNQPLRQLISMKLVHSQKAVHDGRIRQLNLTSSGKALERQLTSTQIKLLETVFDEVGADAELAWKAIMLQLSQQD